MELRYIFIPGDPGTANGAYRTRLFIGFQESPNRRLFAVVLKYKNGQLVNDTPGGRRSITAEVKKQQDGTWRVTRFAVEGVGSC